MSNAEIGADPSLATIGRCRFALGLALLTTTVGWSALTIDFVRSLSASFGQGKGIVEALFLYFRYFTILTNIGIAILTSVTVHRLAGGRALPAPRFYNAALAYILVTCVTYEVMLRHKWRPQGLQFATDVVIHDLVPALVAIFCLWFAPRRGARWRDAVWMLIYPVVYFVAMVAAGAAGEGYPYSFLNVDRLGLPRVLTTAAVFLAIFYGLGVVATAYSRALRSASSAGMNAPG